MKDMNQVSGESSSINFMYVFVLSVVAALGGLLFGYDTAVINGALPYLTAHFELDSFMQGWATSCALIGCMVGAVCAGWLSDRFGRKRALILSAVLFSVSAIGSALPRSLDEFIIARFVGGVGVGIASILSPLYIAEVAPAKIRGALVTLNQLAIVAGMLVVYFVNAKIAGRGDLAWNETLGWRWMFGSETLPALLFFGLLLPIPESPRWLTQKNREEEGFRILRNVGGETHARQELQEIKEMLAQETGSLRQLFAPGFRIALMIGICLAILQQATGINTIIYYASIIFESMELDSSTALNQTVIIGLTNMIFTVAAYFFVDLFGRKFLLILSSFGMGVSLVLTAFGLMIQQSPEMVDRIPLIGVTIHQLAQITQNTLGFENGLSIVILVFILAYVASFAIGMGAVVWVVLSEIFPTQIRGRAMSIAVLVLWISCFLVAQFFPIMLEYFQGKVFFIYAFMCLIHILFVFFLVPETKGRSLEDIERNWMKKASRG